jgi:hypothetical protein
MAQASGHYSVCLSMLFQHASERSSLRKEQHIENY